MKTAKKIADLPIETQLKLGFALVRLLRLTPLEEAHVAEMEAGKNEKSLRFARAEAEAPTLPAYETEPKHYADHAIKLLALLMVRTALLTEIERGLEEAFQAPRSSACWGVDHSLERAKDWAGRKYVALHFPGPEETIDRIAGYAKELLPVPSLAALNAAVDAWKTEIEAIGEKKRTKAQQQKLDRLRKRWRVAGSQVEAEREEAIAKIRAAFMANPGDVG